MGFNRYKNGVPNVIGHRWINNPNNAHKKCTKCGATVDVFTVKYETKCVYKDKYGHELDKCPDCV